MLVAYIAMAVWLLIAAALRIALQLGSGIPLDPLPFVSGALGLLALLALVPGYEEWRERRRHAEPPQKPTRAAD
jgi:hypothetical protein